MENAETISETQGNDLSRVAFFILFERTSIAGPPQTGEKIGGDATVQFSILKDSGLAAVKLTDGAGHAALGDLAINAVANPGPFPVLTAPFNRQFLDVRVRFE